MQYIANKYIPTARGVEIDGIRNDCVIRAVANSTGKNYFAIEKFAIEHCDYKRNGSGMNITGIMKVSQAFGVGLTHVVGTTNAATAFLHQATLLKKEGVKHVKGRTVENVLPLLNKGRYMVHVRGHIFAVVDGHVLDRGYTSKNARVTAIFKAL